MWTSSNSRSRTERGRGLTKTWVAIGCVVRAVGFGPSGRLLSLGRREYRRGVSMTTHIRYQSSTIHLTASDSIAIKSNWKARFPLSNRPSIAFSTSFCLVSSCHFYWPDKIIRRKWNITIVSLPSLWQPAQHLATSIFTHLLLFT